MTKQHVQLNCSATLICHILFFPHKLLLPYSRLLTSSKSNGMRCEVTGHGLATAVAMDTRHVARLG